MIDPLKLKTTDAKNFFCLRAKTHVHIGGVKYNISGYPYMSQDGDVTVCAHSTLWGMCRYLSETYSTYREFLPFDFIRLMSKDAGRTYPYRGMTYSDYCKILADFGCYPLIVRLKKNKDDTMSNDEFKNLYTYVESGFPVLASFSGHAVSLIGHTIDYDKSIDNITDDFIDSSFFLKHFITIDDNYFPYQFLGYTGDTVNYSPRYHIEDIVTSVCPLPEKVFLPAEKARAITLRYLDAMKKRLKDLEKQPWITRLFVTTNSSFKRRKIENSINNRDGSLDKICQIIPYLNMPHFIWVMEASTVEQYKQGLCIAEIVIDPTANDREPTLLYARVGTTLFIGGIKTENGFGIKEIPFSGQCNDFKQYTHNLGEF
jgi:hypothetical protein